jgi:hypothetical protein
MRKNISKHTPLLHMGLPEAVAYATVYLVSPAGAWSCGRVLDHRFDPPHKDNAHASSHVECSFRLTSERIVLI